MNGCTATALQQLQGKSQFNVVYLVRVSTLSEVAFTPAGHAPLGCVLVRSLSLWRNI